MEFHYTPTRESYTMKLRTVSEGYDFPVRLAAKFKIYLNQTENNGNTIKRGLDIGCATGASVFEMSKYFDAVVGIDYSEVFVALAEEVKQSDVSSFKNKNEKVKYAAPVQGTITEERSTHCPKNTFPEKCAFYVGDAMNLTTEKKEDVLTSGGHNNRKI
ncbi:Methyltransferase domain containing protein, putative [Angomonas deanei]|uniref:Methyltransferase domain containing protein, putative n=1 Tax=Angomonas deanei TaxID=59799 RepID=A0A7G2CSU2_9TRYP|nr:Methyltransferase domain containing protein, putative [Angomonas deanei]